MGILEAIFDNVFNNVILRAFLGCFGGGIVFVIVYFLSKRLFDNSLDFSLLDSSLQKSSSLESSLLESSTQKSPFLDSVFLDSPFLDSAFLDSTLPKPKPKSNPPKSRISNVSNVITRFFKSPRFLLSLLASLIFVLLSVFVIDFDMVFSLIFSPSSFVANFSTNFVASPFANHFGNLFENPFEKFFKNPAFGIPLDFSLFMRDDFAIEMIILSLFYVWVCAMFGLAFVLCAFDWKYFAILDSHNVAFLALCACKIFFVMLFGVFSTAESIAESIEVAKDILLGAGLLCLPLLFGKIFLGKEILGEGDIIFCAGFSGLFGCYFLSLSIFWGCVLASVGFIVVFIYAKISLKFFESKSQKGAKSPTYPRIFTHIPFVPFIVLGGFVVICLDSLK